MSETGHLSVNFVRLLETSSHIQGAIGALNSQLEQLESDAAPLVATWSGEARQAYQERQATWRQASGELATMLTAIKRALDDSMVDYEGTEKQNVRLFTA